MVFAKEIIIMKVIYVQLLPVTSAPRAIFRRRCSLLV